jgi:hypothetical protein
MTVCKDSNVRLVRTQRERERERLRETKDTKQIGTKNWVTLKEKKFSNAQSYALGDVHLVQTSLEGIFFPIGKLALSFRASILTSLIGLL